MLRVRQARDGFLADKLGQEDYQKRSTGSASSPHHPSKTFAQTIEANRRNAENNTGQRSKTGKQRSSRNAIRHGLTAETVIEPLEEPRITGLCRSHWREF